MSNPKDMSDKELDDAIANIRNQFSGDPDNFANFLRLMMNSDLDALLNEKHERLAKSIKSININGIDIDLS